MLRFTPSEVEILDLLLTSSPSVVAQKLKIKRQKAYSTKNYFLRKVQNAREFLAVANSKYKPLLKKRLNTPAIMPVAEELY